MTYEPELKFYYYDKSTLPLSLSFSLNQARISNDR